jgi:hypothetical protein
MTGTDRSMAEPLCQCPPGVPHGQTESGGIVLAVICWTPSAQRQCYPTGRCTYRLQSLLDCQYNFSLSLSLSLSFSLSLSLSLSLSNPPTPLPSPSRRSVWDPETSRERIGDWGGPETVWALFPWAPLVCCQQGVPQG